MHEKKVKSQTTHITNIEQIELNTKINLIIHKIIKCRIKAVGVIIPQMKQYLESLKNKKQEIIKQMITVRKEKAIIIQKNFRRFYMQNHINGILKKYDYIFFYDYNYSTKENLNWNKLAEQNMISIKIKNEKKDLCYSLLYSKILKIHYLPIMKMGVMRKTIKVNFIVNGNVVIDPRYHLYHDEQTGNFFNVIETCQLKSRKYPNVNANKNKLVNMKKEENKFWENIFQIKSFKNTDNLSISSISEKSNDQSDYIIEKLIKQNLKFVNNISTASTTLSTKNSVTTTNIDTSIVKPILKKSSNLPSNFSSKQVAIINP
jgi:hypothetical protein